MSAAPDRASCCGGRHGLLGPLIRPGEQVTADALALMVRMHAPPQVVAHVRLVQIPVFEHPSYLPLLTDHDARVRFQMECRQVPIQAEFFDGEQPGADQLHRSGVDRLHNSFQVVEGRRSGDIPGR